MKVSTQLPFHVSRGFLDGFRVPVPAPTGRIQLSDESTTQGVPLGPILEGTD